MNTSEISALKKRALDALSDEDTMLLQVQHKTETEKAHAVLAVHIPTLKYLGAATPQATLDLIEKIERLEEIASLMNELNNLSAGQELEDTPQKIYEVRTKMLKALNAYFYPELTRREHVESPDCWCEPELIADHTDEGGTKAYLHKEEQ